MHAFAPPSRTRSAKNDDYLDCPWMVMQVIWHVQITQANKSGMLDQKVFGQALQQ